MRDLLPHSLAQGLLLIALITTPFSDSLADTRSHNASTWVGGTLWGAKCVGIPHPATITDYRQRHTFAKTESIERGHFPTNSEYLRNEPRRYLEDIDFTLNWFPNHHRALNSAIKARLDTRNKFEIIKWPPAECYLQRAVNFAPDDAMVYMLYGILLQRMDRPEDALVQYSRAEELQPANLQIKYNLGMLFFDLEKYEESQEYAQFVYSKDFPLQGLQRKLSEKGYSINKPEAN